MYRPQSILTVQDTSTGELVAQLSTKLGSCDVLRQNPWNACLCLGHANGVVTMWSPNIGQPLVKMLSHKVDPTLEYFMTKSCADLDAIQTVMALLFLLFLGSETSRADICLIRPPTESRHTDCTHDSWYSIDWKSQLVQKLKCLGSQSFYISTWFVPFCCVKISWKQR